MLSYVHGATAVPLLGETIFQNLRRTAERFAEREALVVPHQGHRSTYAELVKQSEAVARGLVARGVRKGDRVGIWSPNRFEWVIVQYATAAIGAILVNINPAYRTSELEYVLNQSSTSFLVLAARFRQADYVAMLAEVKARCPELREALVLEDSWAALQRDAENISLDDLHEIEGSLQFDDPINIQYTSGTTGFPKGATLTHHNILNNAYFVGETLRYTQADRICIPVPFYHCFGMVMGNLGCTSHGATMVIPGEAFDPVAVMETVQREKCTSLYGVPTMFIAELEHPRFNDFDFSSLRTGIMAGSPCPIEVMKKVQTVMHIPEMTICYGMTETSPVSTQCATDDPLDRRVSTVGRVHPHVEIKIVDPTTGATIDRGETGEFCTRGYSVMRGYWNNEEATRQAVDPARWMHTGDLATMDGNGYINIVGRIKDKIVRGGENIYPREVEEFLYTHPDVADVQVIGVPSEKYGEEVMAWVKPREGAHVTGEELAAWCKGKIASFKIPRHWKLVDSFPMTVTGKVQKFKNARSGHRRVGPGESGRYPNGLDGAYVKLSYGNAAAKGS
ncbi:MAG TPA: AMP-binding protein [Candidatus Acidoferrum sp.]|jgi:fatty-acyl-CoA synthase|nr:AMP-binding protein [Candidatus Acidoferrum sp.]